MTTKIQWCDEAPNPIRAMYKGRDGWHCEKRGPGCLHCYAERMNKNGLRGRGTRLPFTRASRDKLVLRLDEKTLTKPLRWQKPRAIFWCDMTDLFGEWVPDAYINAIAAVCALTPQHTHLWLTKRPERMAKWCNHAGTLKAVCNVIWDMGKSFDTQRSVPPDNLWLGTSISTQADADKNIPALLECPGKKFVSYEPAAGPVIFPFEDEYRALACPACRGRSVEQETWSHTWRCGACGSTGTGNADFTPMIDAVIIGGESGPKARLCEWQWLKSAAEQCQEAGVPCFMKQWGSSPPVYLKSRKGDDPAEWPEVMPRELAWEIKNEHYHRR